MIFFFRYLAHAIGCIALASIGCNWDAFCSRVCGVESNPTADRLFVCEIALPKNPFQESLLTGDEAGTDDLYEDWEYAERTQRAEDNGDAGERDDEAKIHWIARPAENS